MENISNLLLEYRKDVNKSFRFTFNTKEKYNDASANIIFDNSEIINITKIPENEIGGMKYQCK